MLISRRFIRVVLCCSIVLSASLAMTLAEDQQDAPADGGTIAADSRLHEEFWRQLRRPSVVARFEVTDEQRQQIEQKRKEAAAQEEELRQAYRARMPAGFDRAASLKLAEEFTKERAARQAKVIRQIETEILTPEQSRALYEYLQERTNPGVEEPGLQVPRGVKGELGNLGRRNFVAQLDLTSRQMAQLQSLIDGFDSELRAEYKKRLAEPGADVQAVMAEYRAEREQRIEEAREKLKEILTPTQVETLGRLSAELEQEHARLERLIKVPKWATGAVEDFGRRRIQTQLLITEEQHPKLKRVIETLEKEDEALRQQLNQRTSGLPVKERAEQLKLVVQQLQEHRDKALKTAEIQMRNILTPEQWGIVESRGLIEVTEEDEEDEEDAPRRPRRESSRRESRGHSADVAAASRTGLPATGGSEHRSADALFNVSETQGVLAILALAVTTAEETAADSESAEDSPKDDSPKEDSPAADAPAKPEDAATPANEPAKDAAAKEETAAEKGETAKEEAPKETTGNDSSGDKNPAGTPAATEPAEKTDPPAEKPAVPENADPQPATPEPASPEPASPPAAGSGAPGSGAPGESRGNFGFRRFRSGSTNSPRPTENSSSTPAAAEDGTNGTGSFPTTTANGTQLLSFNFRYAPWELVLKRFAEAADLTLDMNVVPPGTFNYYDRKSYTPTEALDVLNGYLLQRGYLLVRRDQFLVVVKISDGIPPNLIPRVTVDELPNRGRNEMISVVLGTPPGADPDEIAQEVKQLLGPQGTVVALTNSNRLLVTDIGSNVMRVHQLLHGDLEAGASGFRAFHLKNISAVEAEQIVRDLFGLLPRGVTPTPPTPQRTERSSERRFRGFGGGGRDSSPPPQAPPAAPPQQEKVKVAIDLRTNSLLVTASPENLAIVEQAIRAVDVNPADSVGGSDDMVRTIPLGGRDPQELLRLLEGVWPQSSANPIRIVVPSAVGPALRDSSGNRLDGSFRDERPQPSRGRGLESPASRGNRSRPATSPPIEEQSGDSNDGLFEVTDDVDETAADAPADRFDGRAQRNPAAAVDPEPIAEFAPAGRDETIPGAPIIIAPQGGNLLITSGDKEALDRVERLIQTLARVAPAQPRWTVFYLRSADATATATILGQLFPGGSVMPAVGGTEGEGNTSTNLLGMMGLSQLTATPQTLRIIPEVRQNALFIAGPPDQIQQIEEVLKVLDASELPESLRDRVPRMIPVEFANVSDVAAIVRDVYKEELEGVQAAAPQGRGRGGRGGGGSDNPLAALFGGGGGGEAVNAQRRGIQMTLGIDTQSNSLIVSASDSLFRQVEALVATIDLAAEDSASTVRVVPLENGNPAIVQQTLTSLIGKIRVSTTTSGSTPAATSTPGQSTGSTPSSAGQSDAMRQMFEQRMRERMSEGSRGGGDSGRSFRGFGGRSRGRSN